MRKFIILFLMLILIGCREGGSSSSESSHSTSYPWLDSPSRPWTVVTQAGIKIITDMSTIEQYEATWEGIFHWEEIDWVTLDEEFELYKQYFCYELNWDCKHTTPSDITVYIKPWDIRCKDAETPSQPREIYEYMNGGWQCIDGWYYKQVVYFHLGDDPGIDHTVVNESSTWTDYDAFQESAYSHELLHFFQEAAGLPFSDTYELPKLLIIYTLHPPDEETDLF